MSPSRHVRADGVWVDLGGDGGGGGGEGGYQRPADWLTLPAVNDGDQKFVGLHAVYDHESNFVAVQCQGAYIIDWGDGTVEDRATNSITYHNYAFADLGPETLSERGYRQAIVIITPQAGQNLTKVDLFIKHNQTALTFGYSSGWLDIRVAGSLISTLTFGGSSSTVMRNRMLEQFEYVGPSAITTCSNLFTDATRLRSIVGTLWTANVIDFTRMFGNCLALETIPLIDTGVGTIFNTIFSGCSSLREIPLLNTSAGTNFTSMFSTCSALLGIPLLDTAQGTLFNTMFTNCSSLLEVPPLNVAAGTSFTGMFTSCNSLRKVGMVGTSRTIVYSNCALGPVALDAIYTNLASGVTAQTITVTSNWGTGVDDPSIATTKGWTVIGS